MEKTKRIQTQQTLILKATVAAYVAYLGFTLMRDNFVKLSEGGLKFVIGGGLLLVASIALFAFSIKSLAKGEYKGGKADASESDEETSDSNIVETEENQK